jgi:hypothetical protein
MINNQGDVKIYASKYVEDVTFLLSCINQPSLPAEKESSILAASPMGKKKRTDV